MIKRPHIFYCKIVDDLMHENESYESFCTNLFTGEWWAHWICAGAICHNWNIPINIVTPSHGSVVCMFHECKDVKIILITNGWPENGIEITHYSSTQREDEDRNLIPNFNREWPKKQPYIFLDPMRPKEEAKGMVLDRTEENTSLPI